VVICRLPLRNNKARALSNIYKSGDCPERMVSMLHRAVLIDGAAAEKAPTYP
jgi:hypothetical protein